MIGIILSLFWHNDIILSSQHSSYSENMCMEYSPSISFAFWTIFSRIEKNENNIIQVLTNKKEIQRG